ncbi:chemotaxis protein CheW [Jannaschia sp. LMIT008]|uniref:chemotaxis protein CheW n=1 Tax=Jannaschia maritima TaxID=3032585 RepID=UPI00281248C6|nr:chemotaxis protein CheW [Jannaschia sp. LMIT008]
MNASAAAAIDSVPAPSAAGNADIQGRVEYLTFLTHGKRFAAPITEVREIRNWSNPTSLPHAQSHLLGVVNLRGTVLPVVDLAMRLGMGPTEPAPRNVFVVVEVDDRPVGLLVEAVADIVAPGPDDHQPLPESSAEVSDLIAGLILADEGMIQVLQLSALQPTRHEMGDAAKTRVEEAN